MDKISTQYLSENRDNFNDLLRFANMLKQYAPRTRVGNMTNARYWLEMNDIIIPKAKCQFLSSRLGKGKTITRDHPLSLEDVKKWFEHLSPMGRVLLMMQISSGMRIGEVLALLPEDINWNSDPVEITIKGSFCPSLGTISTTKNQEERYSFISSEAVFSLKEWLKIRDEWFATACKRVGICNKNLNDPRLFPITHSTAHVIYTNGLKHAGLINIDKNSKRKTISSHSLRKYFYSQMKTAMPEEMVDLIIGHKEYLSDSYRRYPKEQVANAYAKAEYAVSINTSENIPAIKADLLSQAEALRTINAQYIQVLAENRDIKVSMEEKNRELEEQLEAVQMLLKKLSKNQQQ